MAHRITTQRRTLAGTNPKKSASMESTSLRKQPPPLTRPKNPDPLPIPNNKQLSKSFDSCQIQKPISQKAFYSLVGFSTDKSRREKRGEEDREKVARFEEEDRDKVARFEEEDRDKVACLKKKGFEEEKKRKKKLGALRSSVSVGGARQEVELADVFAGNGVKVVSADMPPFMQIHAVELARKVHDSAEKFTSKTLASTLKKEFDGIYGPAWHCIVGTSFGSFVTHSVGGFLYFSMDQKFYILLFKTTVQRAD